MHVANRTFQLFLQQSQGKSGDRATLVVTTIPERDPAAVAVRNVRKLNLAVPIIARAHRVADREDLLKNGATHVIEPETEASSTLVSNALRYLHLPEPSAEGYVATLRAGLENDAGIPQIGGSFPALQEITVGRFDQDGQTLAEAHVRERFGVTVVAVRSASGEVLVNPPAATSIRSGDKLRVFGLPKQIAEFAAYVQGTVQ